MPDSPLTLNFPASLDTVVSGGEVANRAFTTLSDILNDTDLSVPLTSGTLFPSTGVITLTDSLTAPTKTEDVIYTANSANTLTVPTGGRGAFGSTAQNWSGTVYVRMRMMAEHHEWARDAIIQLETIVGADATPLASRYATISHNHSGVYEPANANIQAHIASTSNPHSVTKSQVGLGSVENTALSTWAGSTNLTTLGTIATGTWNGAVIGASYGGAGSINGILKANGSGTVSAAVSGTDYLSATAPGSSGELLYNNANAYAAASLVKYAASGNPSLTMEANASGSAFFSESANATLVGVGGFPAITTIQTANESTFWNLAYVNENSSSNWANYIDGFGDLIFQNYTTSDVAQGMVYFTPSGAIAAQATDGFLFSGTHKTIAGDQFGLWCAGGGVSHLGHTTDGTLTGATSDFSIGSRGITLRAPASAIADGSVAASHLHFYQDETADTLSVKWKESGGTVHSLTFGASGANAALSNLSSVSINASLIPQTTINLGAQATPWKNLWLYGGGTFGSHSIKLDGTPTGHRTITFPDATDTVAVLGTAQTFTAIQTFNNGVTTGTGATAGTVFTYNSLTTGNGVDISSSSVTTGSVVKMSSTSTAAGSNTQTVLNVATSGANATGSQTTFAAQFSNTHTGTSSTNIGLYATASGGTVNLAAQFDAMVAFSGVTASFPALKRSGSDLEIRTATDSGYRGLTGSFFIATNSANNKAALDGTGTNGALLSSDSRVTWSNSASSAYNTIDTAFARAGQAATIRVQGSSSTTAATFSTPALSPAQITSDQNNYAPSTGWFQRWSSDASRNVTGLVAGVDGQIVEIWNVGSNNIVLVNESASSTAANRFATSTGADLTLVAGKCALGRYDATTSRWRVRLGN